jgi:hypothetical protein
MKIGKRIWQVGRYLRSYTVTNRIVSFGGVGSSSLVAHLEEGDRSRIWYHSRDKHCIEPDLLPEARRGLPVKACFLFGDPYRAVLSVFRRGLQRRHEQAMSRTKPGYRVVLQHDTPLEAYLAEGVDRFFLEEHLDNWVAYQGDRVEVLAIRYEALGDHIQEVLAFLDCPRPFQVRARTSSLSDQPTPIRRGLESIYGGLKARIEAMPPLLRVESRE